MKFQQCPSCGAVLGATGCPNGCDDIEREQLIKQLFSVTMPWGVRLQVVQQMSVPITTAGSNYYSGGCQRCPYTACVGVSCPWHPSHYALKQNGIDLSIVPSEDLKKELAKRGE